MLNELARPLPESVQEIADVIGRDQALTFIGQLPQAGKRKWRVCVYIPKTLSPDHKLVEMLGYRDAERMVRAFSGMILQPSNCRYLEREARWRRVLELSAEGVIEDEIADQLDLSASRVREIIAGRKVTWSGRKPAEGPA